MVGFWFWFLVVIVVILVITGVRLINQYQRGVVLRLGRIRPRVKEPGLRLIIPIVDQMRKVDIRIVTLPVDSQKIITKDNVSIDVAAVAYYQVSDPIKSVVEIQNVISATYQIAQTTVRNVVGQSALDEVLSNTSAINDKIKEILDVATAKWGIFVSTVALKDIQLPETMQRAMAKQAEAEREKRAKIIAAEGEKLSATALGEAADIINAHPIALQLRNLQVLSEIAVEKNSTIVFPNQFLSTIDDVKKFLAKEQQ
ncbi:TPA: band 7 domain-containing protein [Candidatus Saccharibacteria bacterium]|nr:MAG: SPFH domain, Band 7 family protein [Candidatus Saccharibacteria bacterium GW2011_GWA2_46_10]OGL36324.1 MAG: band 7 domain-containing protein [Candidatus Saccharibacteria bacterium RIFCSPHIGHO2_12_FULL_47_17]HCM51729.1 band 7 domain-containing protein [Candidatus Saccharibacteria bacterium]